jgi:hypothetical protein
MKKLKQGFSRKLEFVQRRVCPSVKMGPENSLPTERSFRPDRLHVEQSNVVDFILLIGFLSYLL